MCGIAGYYIKDEPTQNTTNLLKMVRSLRHRGPDDEGFVLANKKTHEVLSFSGKESDPEIQNRLPSIEKHSNGFSHDLALGFRRFSIIDISAGGHQPMWDTTKQVCLTTNGEIYNYLEIRSDLESEGYHFGTNSDTEVLLAAYLKWGTAAFERFNGPWALALYDRRKGRVLLSRDRLGKSPLYYAVVNDTLYWASEIKAIIEVCGIDRFSIHDQAIDDYLIHGFRDLDRTTFWEGINDFPPASYAWINNNLSLDFQRYWDIPQKRLCPKDIPLGEATDHFRTLLTSAIEIRTRADVPVAFELSGGMDSSSLVGLVASRGGTKLSTYTIKFEEAHSNEEPFARGLAEKYPDSIEYNVIRPAREDFWDGADAFIPLEEEPFHHPNLHTNQNLRRHIRQAGNRVVITGSAGDEVLAGYAHQYYVPYLRYLIGKGSLSAAGREILQHSEYSSVRALASIIVQDSGKRFIKRLRYSSLLQDIYRRPIKVMLRRQQPVSFNRIMIENMTKWRLNYWLRSGNKSNFGIPIEPRAPFLDYRVVEFAFTLPPEYLIQHGWHKYILRKSVESILPETIVWRRKKMGFPFPLREWLAHSRSIISKNLSQLDCPYLDERKLMQLYDEFARKAPIVLWRVVCLGLWWRKTIENRSIISR